MKVLTFDSTLQRDRDRYKWLYVGFNMGAGAALEQGDKGPAVARVNAAIMDKLDAISDGCDDSETWPGFTIEDAGFLSRTLHDGPQVVGVKDSELNRLKAAVSAASLRFTPLIQRRYFIDLFEFLEGAKDAAESGDHDHV